MTSGCRIRAGPFQLTAFSNILYGAPLHLFCFSFANPPQGDWARAIWQRCSGPGSSHLAMLRAKTQKAGGLWAPAKHLKGLTLPELQQQACRRMQQHNRRTQVHLLLVFKARRIGCLTHEMRMQGKALTRPRWLRCHQTASEE